MGTTLSKPFLSLLKAPLLVHTLYNILQSALIRKIIVVVASEREALCQKVLQEYGPFPIPVEIAHGGSERQDSVRLGLTALDSSSEIVAIHDAVRPFISIDIFDASIKSAALNGGAIVAVPVQDTIKRVTEDRQVIETVPRKDLWLAQTPQTFRTPLIREAHARAQVEGVIATDDASLLEWMGRTVNIVPGNPRNFKITTLEDLKLAEALLRMEPRRS